MSMHSFIHFDIVCTYAFLPLCLCHNPCGCFVWMHVFFGYVWMHVILSHTSCSSYASLSLFLTLFLSLFLIGHFVIYDKKGENYLLLCTFIRRRNSIGKNAFIKGHLLFPWSNIEIFFKLDFYQSKERTASSYLFVWWDSRKKFRP